MRLVVMDTYVDLDREQPKCLEVVAHGISGEYVTTRIPMELLVKLMEHAGFKVTRE